MIIKKIQFWSSGLDFLLMWIYFFIFYFVPSPSNGSLLFFYLFLSFRMVQCSFYIQVLFNSVCVFEVKENVPFHVLLRSGHRVYYRCVRWFFLVLVGGYLMIIIFFSVCVYGMSFVQRMLLTHDHWCLSRLFCFFLFCSVDDLINNKIC